MDKVETGEYDLEYGFMVTFGLRHSKDVTIYQYPGDVETPPDYAEDVPTWTYRFKNGKVMQIRDGDVVWIASAPCKRKRKVTVPVDDSVGTGSVGDGAAVDPDGGQDEA